MNFLRRHLTCRMCSLCRLPVAKNHNFGQTLTFLGLLYRPPFTDEGQIWCARADPRSTQYSPNVVCCCNRTLFLIAMLCIIPLLYYTVIQIKGCHPNHDYAITLSVLGGFTKFFHCCKEQYIYNNWYSRAITYLQYFT